MGVMMCYRNECHNILCTRYSGEFGYICDECFDELVETKPDSIEEFMAKAKTDDKSEDYEDIFRRSRD